MASSKPLVSIPEGFLCLWLPNAFPSTCLNGTKSTNSRRVISRATNRNIGTISKNDKESSGNPAAIEWAAQLPFVPIG